MKKEVYRNQLDRIVQDASTIILGKEHNLKLALACILARGHLLIEDLPGVGKTTLAQVLSRLLDLQFNRIQFTSDMLPADILGISVYAQSTGQFTFHQGPIFANVILADEINRATPKAQSALLEAMEEKQISLEGKTHFLPSPFFVIATQNPLDQIGTFPLPESQLDRFLMSISLGYPDHQAERALLEAKDQRAKLKSVTPCLTGEQLSEMQTDVANITVSDALLDYIQALVHYSRHSKQFHHGLSPRAAIALLHVSKAWAMISGRDYVIPEDIKAVTPAVVGHRLININTDDKSDGIRLLLNTPIP